MPHVLKSTYIKHDIYKVLVAFWICPGAHTRQEPLVASWILPLEREQMSIPKFLHWNGLGRPAIVGNSAWRREQGAISLLDILNIVARHVEAVHKLKLVVFQIKILSCEALQSLVAAVSICLPAGGHG